MKEVGSLDDNLTLNTKGKIYIKYGRKSIPLLNNKGELNVPIQKVIKSASKLESLSDGFYTYDGNLYAAFDGQVVKISGNESSEPESPLKDIGEPKIGDMLLYDSDGWKYNSYKDDLQKINDQLERLNNIINNYDSTN